MEEEFYSDGKAVEVCTAFNKKVTDLFPPHPLAVAPSAELGVKVSRQAARVINSLFRSELSRYLSKKH